MLENPVYLKLPKNKKKEVNNMKRNSQVEIIKKRLDEIISLVNIRSDIMNRTKRELIEDIAIRVDEIKNRLK